MYINKFKLESLLATQGMSKRELSHRAGVSRQSISEILKRGRCQPVTAGKLARGLGVPLDEIVLHMEVIYR